MAKADQATYIQLNKVNLAEPDLRQYDRSIRLLVRPTETTSEVIGACIPYTLIKCIGAGKRVNNCCGGGGSFA